VAEAAAAGVYSAFLPYPFHSDNHQARNAETLVRAGMAEIWTDHAQTSVNMGRHADTLRTLLAKDWGDAISRPAGTTRGVIDGLDAVCEGLARL
jgi:UDP-N-acetylglucosamine:LPS N-acetylglucosamine transferase